MNTFHPAFRNNTFPPAEDLISISKLPPGRPVHINSHLQVLIWDPQDTVTAGHRVPPALPAEKMLLVFELSPPGTPHLKISGLYGQDSPGPPPVNLRNSIFVFMVSPVLLRLFSPRGHAPMSPGRTDQRIGPGSPEDARMLEAAKQLVLLGRKNSRDAPGQLCFAEQSLSLLHLALGRSPGMSGPAAKSDRENVLYCCDRIAEAIRKGEKAPGLKNAARSCGMSVSKFRRIFRCCCRRSYHEFCTDEKLNHAFHLLYHEKKQVKYVAAVSGYSGYGFFIKRFKRKFGVAPHSILNER